MVSNEHAAAPGVARVAAGVGGAPAPARQAAQREAQPALPRLRPQPHQAGVQPGLHQVQDRAACLVSLPILMIKNGRSHLLGKSSSILFLFFFSCYDHDLDLCHT